ncbi:MAG: hypothetical protein EAZ53_07140 [Bacteroidetes bacterium]|nr:MAG: hypothetical protein EAZ53_07140 [Bacteroidota bacterium]
MAPYLFIGLFIFGFIISKYIHYIDFKQKKVLDTDGNVIDSTLENKIPLEFMLICLYNIFCIIFIQPRSGSDFGGQILDVFLILLGIILNLIVSFILLLKKLYFYSFMVFSILLIPILYLVSIGFF